MLHTSVSEGLQQFIARRYQSRASNDLLDYVFANHVFQRVDPELIDFLHSRRQELAAYLAQSAHRQALAAFCIHATTRYTYQRNQFLHFAGEYEQLLHAEYDQVIAQLASMLATPISRERLASAFAALLRQHHKRLRAILAAYCTAAQPGDLAHHPLLQTVPCDEYSPRFQLAVLGCNLRQLREPILDLGCGSDGRLVLFLRQQGLAAFGIDRFAPAGEHFVQGDWFAFDIGSRAWGTIIAHHTISTHFVYSHSHQLPIARQYAQLYRQILRSLAVGGAFCYAPGVPFFEARIASLPAYTITKTPIPLNDWLGIGAIAYATRIRRIV